MSTITPLPQGFILSKDIETYRLSLPAGQGDNPAKPVFSPLPPCRWSEPQKQLFDFISAADASKRKPLHMLQTLAHHPQLLDAFLPMATLLGANARLPRRQVQLLALRIIWRGCSVYEWAHHRDYSCEAGLSEAQIESLLKETPEGDWSEQDYLLIRSADQLFSQTQLDASTMNQLADHFDPAQVLEILFIINHYNGLSKIANSIGITLEDGYVDQGMAGE